MNGTNNILIYSWDSYDSIADYSKREDWLYRRAIVYSVKNKEYYIPKKYKEHKKFLLKIIEKIIEHNAQDWGSLRLVYNAMRWQLYDSNNKIILTGTTWL